MIIPRDTKDRFYVIVYCKPQVRKYIYNQCGDPADLTYLPQINTMFHQLLQNTKLYDKLYEDRQKRGDKRYDQFCQVNYEKPPYPDTMNICINKKQFYRNGFYLNKSGVISFNKFVDDHIKALAVMYVKNKSGLSGNVCEAIRSFQDLMHFTDQDFSFDAIRKHIHRSGINNDENLKDSLNVLFNKNFESNISKKLNLSDKPQKNEKHSSTLKG